MATRTPIQNLMYNAVKEELTANRAKKLLEKKTLVIPTAEFLKDHKECHANSGRRASDTPLKDTSIKGDSTEKVTEAKKGMLQRAYETINGPRQQDYGDKLQNFSQIAMLFQGTLATKLLPSAQITPEDVALLMIQVKIARLAKSPDHKDSILDVAGYAGCYDHLQEERSDGAYLDGAIYDSRQYTTHAGK